MATVFFTLLFFMFMVGAMAIGVLMGRKPIQGSCGGLSAVTREDCPICGGSPAKCDAEQDRLTRLAYDATRK